jgi:hypothetical protein
VLAPAACRAAAGVAYSLVSGRLLSAHQEEMTVRKLLTAVVTALSTTTVPVPGRVITAPQAKRA